MAVSTHSATSVLKIKKPFKLDNYLRSTDKSPPLLPHLVSYLTYDTTYATRFMLDNRFVFSLSCGVCIDKSYRNVILAGSNLIYNTFFQVVSKKEYFLLYLGLP